MHAKIEMDGHGRGKLWLDDKEIPMVKLVRFTGEAGEANSLTVEVIPETVFVTGPVEVTHMTSPCREWRLELPPVDLAKFRRACDRAWFKC